MWVILNWFIGKISSGNNSYWCIIFYQLEIQEIGHSNVSKNTNDF